MVAATEPKLRALVGVLGTFGVTAGLGEPVTPDLSPVPGVSVVGLVAGAALGTFDEGLFAGMFHMPS